MRASREPITEARLEAALLPGGDAAEAAQSHKAQQAAPAVVRGIGRRAVMKGGIALATAVVLKCEAVAKVIAPTQSCGCPRKWPVSYGHTCVVHDENGKRFDSYTFEEIVAEQHDEISIVPKDDEWTCYCGNYAHDDNVMPAGTKCVWRKTSYEYDEWDCECAKCYRENWLSVVTTDWHQMAADEGFCEQPGASHVG